MAFVTPHFSLLFLGNFGEKTSTRSKQVGKFEGKTRNRNNKPGKAWTVKC